MIKIPLSLIPYTLILMLSLWVIGFCVFGLYALGLKYTPTEKTDAIVVLTGGEDRIATALTLLAENQADRLLISGVNRNVSPTELLHAHPGADLNRITLGYTAQNTRENAQETADWIGQQHIGSVLLVTSFYHMPRSIAEILSQTPNTRIIPYPVFPRSFETSIDWIRTRHAWLLFVEYNKFIIVQLKNLIERILKNT